MNRDQSRRPDKVRKAVRLLYVTLGIGVLRSIMEAPRLSEDMSVAFVAHFLLMFAVLGIMWFFIHMIGKGKNWARITFLVLFIIGIPLSVLPLLQRLAANPILGLLGIGQAAIQTVALFILFQKSCSDWFKEMKGAIQAA